MITIMVTTTFNTTIIYFEGAYMHRSLCKFIISFFISSPIHCSKSYRFRGEGKFFQGFKKL